MGPAEVDQLLRPVLLKDLRVILRARGINPAGGKETLEQRLKEHMLATGDFSLRADDDFSQYSALGSESEKQLASDRTNNYSRPGGNQNLGNKMTGRNTSSVSNPPGGASQISFGDYGRQAAAPAPSYMQNPQHYEEQQVASGYTPGYQGTGATYTPRPAQIQFGGPNAAATNYHTASGAYGNAHPSPQPGQGGGSPVPSQGSNNNNYSRPNGMQNVGNFLTDRPSSRVLAPPGGKSQISFG